MNKSESIKELATALAKAQAEIEVAKKDVQNTFFRSQYADLPAVWKACRAALSKNGLSVTQVTDTSENGMTLESILMHNSGEWISSLWPINPAKQDSQSIMSAVTYARRGSLACLVGVVADDSSDDDGNAASGNHAGLISSAMSAPSSSEANLTRIEHFKAEGREAAEGGSDVLYAWWKRMLKSDQEKLVKFKDETLKQIAEAADKVAAQ